MRHVFRAEPAALHRDVDGRHATANDHDPAPDWQDDLSAACLNSAIYRTASMTPSMSSDSMPSRLTPDRPIARKTASKPRRRLSSESSRQSATSVRTRCRRSRGCSLPRAGQSRRPSCRRRFRIRSSPASFPSRQYTVTPCPSRRAGARRRGCGPASDDRDPPSSGDSHARRLRPHLECRVGHVALEETDALGLSSSTLRRGFLASTSVGQTRAHMPPMMFSGVRTPRPRCRRSGSTVWIAGYRCRGAGRRTGSAKQESQRIAAIGASSSTAVDTGPRSCARSADVGRRCDIGAAAWCLRSARRAA